MSVANDLNILVLYFQHILFKNKYRNIPIPSFSPLEFIEENDNSCE